MTRFAEFLPVGYQTERKSVTYCRNRRGRESADVPSLWLVPIIGHHKINLTLPAEVNLTSLSGFEYSFVNDIDART